MNPYIPYILPKPNQASYSPTNAIYGYGGVTNYNSYYAPTNLVGPASQTHHPKDNTVNKDECVCPHGEDVQKISHNVTPNMENRVRFLEKENLSLQKKVSDLEKELSKVMGRLLRLEQISVPSPEAIPTNSKPEKEPSVSDIREMNRSKSPTIPPLQLKLSNDLPCYRDIHKDEPKPSEPSSLQSSPESQSQSLTTSTSFQENKRVTFLNPETEDKTPSPPRRIIRPYDYSDEEEDSSPLIPPSKLENDTKDDITNSSPDDNIPINQLNAILDIPKVEDIKKHEEIAIPSPSAEQSPKTTESIEVKAPKRRANSTGHIRRSSPTNREVSDIEPVGRKHSSPVPLAMAPPIDEWSPDQSKPKKGKKVAAKTAAGTKKTSK